MSSRNGDVAAPEEQLHKACRELAGRLRAGEPCQAEEYLAASPALAAHEESALELVYTEFAVRAELGQQPDPADWYTRFPHWKERLERVIQLGGLLSLGLEAQPVTLVQTPPPPGANIGTGTIGPPPWGDRYELLERLGRGGMGVVFKARQVGLNRLVALKMIRSGDDAQPEELGRFRREAEAMARLRHPNIVPVYAVGECVGLPCFSMEFLEGGSLAARINGRPQPARQAAQWVEALARAAHYAHQQGIVHRDLKPSNVVLTADGTPKITDFGLAKRYDREPGASTIGGQTQSGAVIGTAGYAAPEQAGGNPQEIGPHSDVYALGAVLYELLTGRPPFRGPSQQETLRQVKEEEPTAPRKLHAGVSPELEAICLKCLEKKPSRRYASAEALADDLARWLAGQPTHARPWSWSTRAWRFLRRHRLTSAAAALAVVAAAVMIAVQYHQSPARRLKDIEDSVQAGKPAFLIGETGSPPWFQLRTCSQDLKVAPAVDGTFQVECFGLGLVELRTDPGWERFRFRAEVRHETWSSADTEVGIYCLASKRDSDQGHVVHFCCTLGFNDLGMRLVTKPAVASLATWWFIGPEVYPPSYRIQHQRHTIDPSGPDDGDKSRWRPIAVEVTPEEIRAYWDGNLIPGLWKGAPVDGLSRARLHTDSADLAVRLPKPIAVAGPDFHPRESLGLFVHKGKASFRNVVIEPLP